jgi:type 1 glutamine amidotransferase
VEKEKRRVLVYTRNGDGYVHDNIIEAVEFIRNLPYPAETEIEATEDPAVFTEENLSGYRLIVFPNTNNDAFSTDGQRVAFRRYIEAGGGFVGIHSAMGTERNWEWFKQMIGCTFVWHARLQVCKQVVFQPGHPSMKGVPAEWEIEEECYFGKESYPDRKVLLMHDLKVLNKDEKDTIKANSGNYREYYPSTWYHNFQGGFVWVTSLGHKKETYRMPVFKNLILGGMEFIMEKTTNINPDKSFSTTRDEPLRVLK